MEFSLIDGTSNRFKYYQMLEPEEEISNAEEIGISYQRGVESRLVSDVPVGVFLSGGLDSSIVTSLAAKHMPDIKTFSIGFDSVRHDESKYSISVAKACGVDHHMVGFSEEDFARFLPEIASVIDEPLGDQAAFANLQVVQEEASRHVKVVLSGEGADEFFGGYSYYGRFAAKQSFLQKFFGSRIPTRVHAFLAESDGITPSGFPLVTNNEVWRLLGKESCRETNDQWEAELLSYLDTINDPLRRACVTDVLSWLRGQSSSETRSYDHVDELGGGVHSSRKSSQIIMRFKLPSSKKHNGKESKVNFAISGSTITSRKCLEAKKAGLCFAYGYMVEKVFRSKWWSRVTSSKIVTVLFLTIMFLSCCSRVGQTEFLEQREHFIPW